jgi:hypothetical protein
MILKIINKIIGIVTVSNANNLVEYRIKEFITDKDENTERFLHLSVSSVLSVVLVFLLLVQFSNCISRQIPIPRERLVERVFTKKSNSHKEIPYLLYLPKSYYTNQREELPLVLFLHGKGERGNNLQILKRQGIPKSISDDKTEFPFILIAPQLPENEEEWYTKDLISLVEEIESDYSIDENKIYLTGISLGGNGVWKLATEFPNKFAAVVPISGWGEVSNVCRIKNASVWAFHGAKDTLIPPQKTTEIIDRLQFCNRNVKQTIYTNAKHDAWTETYNNPEFMDWLLQQKKEKQKKEDSSIKKNIHTKENPLKILVIGDSIGISISWGIDKFVQDNYHITMDNFAKVSSGLTQPKFFNWNNKLDELLSLKKYDLGIVLIGANDPQSMTRDSTYFRFNTNEWKTEYIDRIKTIVDKFRKYNMNVYWIELPPMGPGKYHRETRYLNSSYKEASELLGFSFISTTYVLGDTNGNYSKFLPYRGRRTLMRADDDIHLTVVAARLITKEILNKIFIDYYFPD